MALVLEPLVRAFQVPVARRQDLQVDFPTSFNLEPTLLGDVANLRHKVVVDIRFAADHLVDVEGRTTERFTCLA